MSIDTAASDVGFALGDHVCGFYYGEEERDSLLLPFLREGLARGEKCIAVVDSMATDEVVTRLEAAPQSASGQLELYDSDGTYLRTGTFDAELMISFWEERARALNAENEYPSARLLGEMSWLERVPPARESVVRYESWADGFVARYPQAVLCLYDLRKLGSGVLMDLLRTHPKLLLGGLVLENPHHMSVDEFTVTQG